MHIIKVNCYLWRSLILFALILISCNDEGSLDFPETPEIELVSLEYIPVEDIQDPDTLSLTIRYTDGDSDLGLNEDDILSPYNKVDYFYNDQGDLLKIGDNDTLPPYEFPYNCMNYELISSTEESTQDTVYVQQNMDYFNIMVDVYVRSGENEYTYLDWSDAFSPNCEDNFYARFTPPPLGVADQTVGDFRFQTENRFRGQITYKMYSRAFQFLLEEEQIKLKVWVKDRALNTSNIIETPSVKIN